jgi:hypothetical protein
MRRLNPSHTGDLNERAPLLPPSAGTDIQDPGTKNDLDVEERGIPGITETVDENRANKDNNVELVSPAIVVGVLTLGKRCYS